MQATEDKEAMAAATKEATRDHTTRIIKETQIRSIKPHCADTLCNQAPVQLATHAHLLMVNQNSETCKM